MLVAYRFAVFDRGAALLCLLDLVAAVAVDGFDVDLAQGPSRENKTPSFACLNFRPWRSAPPILPVCCSSLDAESRRRQC